MIHFSARLHSTFANHLIDLQSYDANAIGDDLIEPLQYERSAPVSEVLLARHNLAISETWVEDSMPVNGSESDPTASNGEHFNAPEVPQCAKRNSRNRRKRPKVQKAEIKIKMAPDRPRTSTPTELTTDEEDMIM
ncbi:hypothetical protein TNCV_2428091 [Trichonephila clavipes]|nr:hypothetical protein TNCV_2428091 [Trichonephila clavipes]